MSRYVSSVLFTLTACAVWAYNNHFGDGQVVAFSFLERWVGADPQRLGEATVALLAFVAVVLGASAVWQGRSRA